MAITVDVEDMGTPSPSRLEFPPTTPMGAIVRSAAGRFARLIVQGAIIRITAPAPVAAMLAREFQD